ncbi:MAG: FKBP-type peptidyl-prolyl cis-trans isomerase [bacterium]
MGSPIKNPSLSLCIGILLLFISLPSCKNDPQSVRSTSNIRMLDEQVIRYNRGVIKTEDQEIQDFLTRYQWDMTLTPTGLRYLIYRKGTGRKAEKGLSASVSYELRLLNGKLVYSSDSAGLKEILLGHGGVESVLEEGLLLLHQGDKAKFVIPSYLAFGLLGDQNMIPPGATLIYNIELVRLSEPQSNVHK